MLEDDTKEEIQGAYRNWLNDRGFKPRRSQRHMIAEIARAAAADDAAERVVAIEAGTGVGKTVAYLLALVPLVQRLQKRLVISTATIALQEQLVSRDLPDLASHSGLQFSFALAKGRGRYICVQQLDSRLKNPVQGAFDAVLFATPAAASENAGPVYEQLLDQLARGVWNGDRDALAEPVEDGVWSRVTIDGRGCAGPKCDFFRRCPYFMAREEIAETDVVVANHDLVLSDLMVGNAVLPEPEETVYVFDEAHHLADKAQRHFHRSLRVQGTAEWLDGVASFAGSVAQRFGRPDRIEGIARRIGDLVIAGQQELSGIADLAAALDYSDDSARSLHRFPMGIVPADLAELAQPLAQRFELLESELFSLSQQFEHIADGELIVENASDLPAFQMALGNMQSRCEHSAALWSDFSNGSNGSASAGSFADEDEGGRPSDAADHSEGLHEDIPSARWIQQLSDPGSALQEMQFSCGPLLPSTHLQEALWSRSHAVVLTSATLRTLGSFNALFRDLGLPLQTRQLALPSPFDYSRCGVLRVPAMSVDPSDPEAHSLEIAQLLPRLLSDERGQLVLCSSWRQMNTVLAEIDYPNRQELLVQGELNKQQIVAMHRQRIDEGKRSVIIGLASFAEGIDLPGDYLTHVIITKLPFGVPDDPMAQAHAEWIEHRGGNSFYEYSLAQASLRLTQACGRLVRGEADRGMISLLDQRIVTRRYGRQLLDALPPFRQELNTR